jgi:hypothetical protein
MASVAGQLMKEYVGIGPWDFPLRGFFLDGYMSVKQEFGHHDYSSNVKKRQEKIFF